MRYRQRSGRIPGSPPIALRLMLGVASVLSHANHRAL